MHNIKWDSRKNSTKNQNMVLSIESYYLKCQDKKCYTCTHLLWALFVLKIGRFFFFNGRLCTLSKDMFEDWGDTKNPFSQNLWESKVILLNSCVYHTMFLSRRIYGFTPHTGCIKNWYIHKINHKQFQTIIVLVIITRYP